MRIIRTAQLNDGKGFNRGQDAALIRIEDPSDYDRILDAIRSTEYYGGSYFQSNIGHRAQTVKGTNVPVAAMIRMLRPGSVLELGCGRGDILLLLSLCGVAEVAGIDISADAVREMWPRLAGKVRLGDLLDVCPALARERPLFDTVVALDIWEHLHPARLDDYIRAVLAAATPDALFYFSIPAFGPDRSFGEVFPLEFEENRADFEGNRPFSHLLAASVDPPIPAQGHLIWAPSAWWEQQFCRQGLVRAVALETRLHQLFDEHLYHGQKPFFIFHRPAAPVARLAAIADANSDEVSKAASLARLLRAVRHFERSRGSEVLDPNKTLLDINWALARTAGRSREKIRLLVGLLRALGGDARRENSEGWRCLKQTLELSLVERIEELTSGWPVRRGRHRAARFMRWLLLSGTRR